MNAKSVGTPLVSWRCILNPNVRFLVDWAVARSVYHNFLKTSGKLHFHAYIEVLYIVINGSVTSL